MSTKSAIGIKAIVYLLLLMSGQFPVFGQNYYTQSDTMLESGISDLDIIVDGTGVVHMFATRIETDLKLTYLRYNEAYTKLGTEEILANISHSIEPKAFYGSNEILVSWLNQGGFYGLNIAFARISFGGEILAQNELFTDADGYLDNQGVSTISLDSSEYLASWIRNDGSYSGVGAVTRLVASSLSGGDETIPNLNSIGPIVLGYTNLVKNEQDQSVLLTWVEGSYEESNLFCRILTYSGEAISPIYQVNDNTDEALIFSHAAFLGANNEFIVIWNEEQPNYLSKIMERHIQSNGVMNSTPIQILPMLNSIMEISIDQCDDGRVVMVWDEWDPIDSKRDIFGLRIDYEGSPIGSKFSIASSESDVTRWCPRISFVDSQLYSAWTDENNIVWANIIEYDQIQVGIEANDVVVNSPFKVIVMPNPFNPSTTIEYDLPNTTDLSIVVNDLRGRSIWTYEVSSIPAGSYSLQWDGLDNSGNQVASGVYLISLSTPEFRAVQKAVLIR